MSEVGENLPESVVGVVVDKGTDTSSNPANEGQHTKNEPDNSSVNANTQDQEERLRKRDLLVMKLESTRRRKANERVSGKAASLRPRRPQT